MVWIHRSWTTRGVMRNCAHRAAPTVAEGKGNSSERPARPTRKTCHDGGLPAGTVLPEGVAGAGITLREPLPQGHKLALQDIAEGAAVRRYSVTIGYALAPIAAGSWVHERGLRMPLARALKDLPLATEHAPPPEPLTGYTFEGYRNADGSVGTRNILAITTTVQCVAGVVALAVRRIQTELLPL